MDFSVSSTIPKSMSDTIEVVGDLDSNYDIPLGGSILIISNDQSYLTHGIHKFPAKFFPELPRYLIRKYSKKGDSVLDPMCGSGTTLLEAMLNDRRAIGIDIDPIARLISKVKTTPIKTKKLYSDISTLNAQIQEFEDSKSYHPIIPEFNYRDNWFRPFVLRELAIIRDSIDSISAIEHRDFFRVILSSIIRDVSNADPHCTRTVLRKKVVKKIEPRDTIARYRKSLGLQQIAMSEFMAIAETLDSGQVVLPKGTAMTTGLDDRSIDLAVTSPPYINAVDYPRTHQLEMYWLGLLGNGPLSHVKRKYIGTETVYKKEYEKLRTTGYESLDPILEKIYTKDPRRSFIVFKFFEDMKKQLSETFRVLKPGGHYCIAIGNNLIRGVEVHSDEILSEIATSSVGFKLENTFFSKLIRHFIRIPRPERMMGEWILVLQKPP
ncbi:MAG: DNA methyltransferase [Candidatus Thorarchaeota archaeon]|jgi:DNA modification methylase